MLFRSVGLLNDDGDLQALTEEQTFEVLKNSVMALYYKENSTGYFYYVLKLNQ